MQEVLQQQVWKRAPLLCQRCFRRAVAQWTELCEGERWCAPLLPQLLLPHLLLLTLLQRPHHPPRRDGAASPR